MIFVPAARRHLASLSGIERSSPGCLQRQTTSMPRSRSDAAHLPGSSRQMTSRLYSSANARLMSTTSFSVPPALSELTTYARFGRFGLVDAESAMTTLTTLAEASENAGDRAAEFAHGDPHSGHE